MEILLEITEVERLLRKALYSEGVRVPKNAKFYLRSNHKKGTFRVVFESSTNFELP